MTTLDDSPSALDEVLRLLVQEINSSAALEVGVTLSVRGLLISGVAVGWRAYYKGMSAYLRSAARGSDAEKVAGHIASIFDGLVQQQDTAEESNPILKDSPPSFIHLRDARVLLGSESVPRQQGMWWRSRLSEIDGFTVGTLTA
jgi:hypothetical protein